LNITPKEKATKNFLSVEQNIQKAQQIQCILDNNGTEVNDSEKISQAFHGFYKSLYTADPGCGEKKDFLKFVKRLTDFDTEALEKPFSLNDFKTALNGMQNNKTPGPDGSRVL
jgi:predicted esterase YcpF (UPF0227 family)